MGERHIPNLVFNKDVFERCGVDALILFGSYGTHLAHEGSDVDVGILFRDRESRKRDPVSTYGMLHEECVRAFSLPAVDIVYLDETSIPLQYDAAMNGDLLYEARPGVFVDYRERCMQQYFDFAFFERILRGAPLTT